MTDGVTAEPAKTRCIACREVIHPDARLCPHCRSPQSARRWQVLGSALKWVGGVTAVISLVFGMVRANELYSSWRERNDAVEELVRAVELQMQTRDYQGAWQLLAQARELKPGAGEARRLQITLAMAWLRDIRVSGDQSFTDIVDRLLPALYRGATSPRDIAAADVLAHIGWANYLKSREGDRQVEIDAYYERALALDAGNVYAHAHFGHWVLQPRNPRDYDEHDLDKAKRHFAAALGSGREREYVKELALIALAGSSAEGSAGEALRLANEFRKGNETLAALPTALVIDVYKGVARNYRPEKPGTDDPLVLLTAALPSEELLGTFRWLVDGMPQEYGKPETLGSPENRFIIARLIESTGDKAGALARYRSLADDLGAKGNCLNFTYCKRSKLLIERLSAAEKVE